MVRGLNAVSFTLSDMLNQSSAQWVLDILTVHICFFLCTINHFKMIVSLLLCFQNLTGLAI